MTDARWSTEKEQAVAHSIQRAAQRALDALLGVAVAEHILWSRPRQHERLKTAVLDRLSAAVQATCAAVSEQPGLREAAAVASAALGEAESLAWMLALSARQIAVREARRMANGLLAEEDMVQEGYIGLIRAARRYDPTRRVRFATYARWWARAQMTEALANTGRLIRIPGGAVAQLRNVRVETEQRTMARQSTNADALARAVGLRRARLDLLRSQGDACSMEQLDASGRRLADQLTRDANDQPPPDQQIAREEDVQRMWKGIHTLLCPREQEVLTRRYGLSGEDPASAAEVGLQMHLTRARVHQLERQALGRLRTWMAEAGDQPEPARQRQPSADQIPVRPQPRRPEGRRGDAT